MQWTPAVVGKTTEIIYGSTEKTQDQQTQTLATPLPIRARRSCIDPIQPLYELFKASCPYRQLDPNFSLTDPTILERMAQFMKGPLGQWIAMIQKLFPNLNREHVFLTGSAARNLGGKELLKFLFANVSQGLDMRVQKDILSNLDTYKFPYSDFDIHFSFQLGNNYFESLTMIKNTVLSNLPTGVKVVKDPVIIVNREDTRFDPVKYTSFLNIELIGPDGKFDFIFEPEGQYSTLFGADDLMAVLNGDENMVRFFSSDPFLHCEDQIFRKLSKRIVPDHTYHRRMLLSMTRGYYASQELSIECKEAEAARLDHDRRKFLQKVTLSSHLADLNIAQWAYKMAHQIAWGDIPDNLLPDGHILTETLNATHRCPSILPKAHALLQFIGFITLLEDHQIELCASMRDKYLALEFPGEYTVWMPCDPVSTIQVLNEMTLAEWGELKRILRCMPGWIPRGKVNVDYMNSIKDYFHEFKLYDFYKNVTCELLQLRLQAALGSYGAPFVECSQKFWTNALCDENLQISLIHEKLRKRKKNLSEEDIEWMYSILQENNHPQLCRKVADRLIQDQNVKAINFLKLIETSPNIDWKPVCKAITNKDNVQKCLDVQRLITAGIQAFPLDELPLLLSEIDDHLILTRLAEELLVQQNPALFQLSVRLIHKLHLEEQYVERIARRSNDLDEEYLIRYALEKRFVMNEEIMERLISSQTVELKIQVKLLQSYKGLNVERFWRQIATRLTYTPESWPATWSQIPELNPRTQTLWTGVVEFCNQKEFEKAETAITALLKGKIEPPGGRVAFQTWLLLIGAWKKFATLFGLSAKIEDLFEKEPDAVCDTLLCHLGTVELGSAKFVGRVVEYHLNSAKDPWPIYEKLGMRPIDDALRSRWISQATPERICKLLPSYRPGTSFLEHLKRAEVIEEVSCTPSLHPWVNELLLDGPQVEWSAELTVRVCNRLIEQENNPRRVALVARYGRQLPDCIKVIKQVALHDPDEALSFTATWLEQGISPEFIKQLHLLAPKPHSSVEDFFRSCIEQEQYDLAIDLWNKIPFFKNKKFLPLAIELFMRVENLDLAKWVLQTAPLEKKLFMRAIALPIDHDFAVKVLCPHLLRLNLNDFEKPEPEINKRLIPLLTAKDLTIKLVDQIFNTTELDLSTAPEFARICFSKEPEDFEWLTTCWHIIRGIKERHDVWDEGIWTKIFNRITLKLKAKALNPEAFKQLMKLHQFYYYVYGNILCDEFVLNTIPPEQYLILLRCYTLSVENDEDRAKCHSLWEKALNMLPHQRWVVSLLEFITLDLQAPIEPLIVRMEECGWIDNEYASVLRYLMLSEKTFSKATCDEEGVKVVRELCELSEKVFPVLTKYLPALYERFSNIGKLTHPGLGPISRIPSVIFKGLGENEIHAKQMVALFHGLISKFGNFKYLWGDFFRQSYCRDLIEPERQLPHWWIEDLADLLQRHPNLIKHKEEDELVTDLLMCAIACGPESDGDPLLPNKAMQKMHAFVKDCIQKDHLEFDQTMEAKVICLAGGSLTELKELTTNHFNGINKAFEEIYVYDKPLPLLWPWYVNRLRQILLDCCRNNIIIPYEILLTICSSFSSIIKKYCPENEREAMLESHLHFLMSEELRPFFTPPKEITKLPRNFTRKKGTHDNYKTLEEEYKDRRQNCVFTFLWDLCNWGGGIKEKHTQWVNALIKSQFFEPNIRESFKQRWKSLK